MRLQTLEQNVSDLWALIEPDLISDALASGKLPSSYTQLSAHVGQFTFDFVQYIAAKASHDHACNLSWLVTHSHLLVREVSEGVTLRDAIAEIRRCYERDRMIDTLNRWISQLQGIPLHDLNAESLKTEIRARLNDFVATV